MLSPLFQKICVHGTQTLTAQDRERLYLASIYGGFGISVTGTAFPHAMGYFLTETYGLPHGVACEAFLPAFLRHADACEHAAAQSFYARVGCGMEEWISLLQGVTPTYDVQMTAEQVESLRPRFTGNGGLTRSPGNMTAEDALQIVRERFLVR